MTLTESQAQKVEAQSAALLRNAEIREMHRRRELGMARNPTQLLTARESRRLLKPDSKVAAIWRKLKALF